MLLSLGRREKSGEAIALVEIDQIIDENVLDKIKNLPQVVRANVINFKYYIKIFHYF